jgi:hypothetical protein
VERDVSYKLNASRPGQSASSADAGTIAGSAKYASSAYEVSDASISDIKYESTISSTGVCRRVTG